MTFLSIPIVYSVYSFWAASLIFCEILGFNTAMTSAFSIDSEVLKVDPALGIVMGYAIISTENGEPYYDLQGDHIPEESMLKAAVDFAENSRVASEMHTGESRGTVLFTWPLTGEIAKSFGIQTERTGLLIAMKPDTDMLAKFQSGELKGFSIGGVRIEDEEVD